MLKHLQRLYSSFDNLRFQFLSLNFASCNTCYLCDELKFRVKINNRQYNERVVSRRSDMEQGRIFCGVCISFIYLSVWSFSFSGDGVLALVQDGRSCRVSYSYHN